MHQFFFVAIITIKAISHSKHSPKTKAFAQQAFVDHNVECAVWIMTVYGWKMCALDKIEFGRPNSKHSDRPFRLTNKWNKTLREMYIAWPTWTYKINSFKCKANKRKTKLRFDPSFDIFHFIFSSFLYFCCFGIDSAKESCEPNLVHAQYAFQWL